jgi:phage terminase large subunit-like protein
MAWWEADPEGDHKDPAQWAKANPGFNDLVSLQDFESSVRLTSEAEFRTKRLNQWVNAKEAWLPAGVWENLTTEFEISPDDEYVLGFDGSWNNDSTSIVAVILPKEEGKPFRVSRVASWEKNFAIDDDSWRVSKDEVTAWLMDFTEKYPRIKEMACDPSYWFDELLLWQESGIPVVMYRNSPERTVPATSKLYDAIMNGKFIHNGDPALTRHIENCVLKVDARGARITKDHRQPKLKVDNAIALLMAYDRASARMEEQVIPQFYS